MVDPFAGTPRARDGAVVGRLAPSPTGHLHLGHARTFLLGWCSARSAGGRVVLRLEDLDGERCNPNWADECQRDLEWLGLDWDGPARLQSSGLERILAAARSLEAEGLAYACVCSRRDLRESVSAPHGTGGEIPYTGRCRERFASRQQAQAQTGEAAALRFRVPDESVVVKDVLFGERAFNVQKETGDFPILRRDGTPAYQLAVVVDDAADGVTEVVRGDDLLPSAARQQLLQQALGLPTPRWCHAPLVLDGTGQRLAKRSDSVSLASLRERGVAPSAIVGWAAQSLGLINEAREVNPRELLGHFELCRVDKRPTTVDSGVLRALLGHRA